MESFDFHTGLNAEHRWGGVADTCALFSVASYIVPQSTLFEHIFQHAQGYDPSATQRALKLFMQPIGHAFQGEELKARHNSDRSVRPRHEPAVGHTVYKVRVYFRADFFTEYDLILHIRAFQAA